MKRVNFKSVQNLVHNGLEIKVMLLLLLSLFTRRHFSFLIHVSNAFVPEEMFVLSDVNILCISAGSGFRSVPPVGSEAT